MNDSEELPSWEREEDSDLEASVNEALKGISLPEKDDLADAIRQIIREQLYSFNVDEEVAELRMMKEEQPESTLYIREGLAAFYRGDFEAALELLAAVERPSSFVTFLIADSEASIGDLDKAIEDYGKVIEANPKNVDALLATACAYYTLDDAEHQLDFLNKALALDENRQIAWRARGFVYLGRGDLDHSHTDFSRALHLDPEDWEAHLGLARVYHMQGKMEEAMKHYDTCLEHAPDAPVVLYYRACAQFDLGRLPDALADLDAALQHSSDDVDIVLKIGEVYDAEGKYQHAAFHYRHALKLAGDDVEKRTEAIEGLGYAFLSDGRPYDALELAKELFALERTFEGLLLRGDARLHLGDWNGAMNDCTLARIADSESLAAIDLMQRILTERGRVREAKKYQIELDRLLAA